MPRTRSHVGYGLPAIEKPLAFKKGLGIAEGDAANTGQRKGSAYVNIVSVFLSSVFKGHQPLKRPCIDASAQAL